MKRLLALSVVAALLAAVGYLDARHDGASEATRGEHVSYASERGAMRQGPPLDRLERAIKMKAGTKKALGGFTLANGRRVELYTAETEDAKACLIESDSAAGAGAGCLEGGLFAARKVAFSVNTDGGPKRFDYLYVVGVVAQGIGSASLTLTDGREVALRLTSERTFVFESAEADLAAGVYPNSFRLFRPNGKLAETVLFPPAGS